MNLRGCVGGLSVMRVGMLSASYLPGRFHALNVSSLSPVISHFFPVRDRMATYVICHHSHFGLLREESIFAVLSHL